MEQGFPLVTSKNLSNGLIDFSNVQYISEADHINICKRSYVENGDILFAMIGSIGNPVIVKKDREFSIKNVALFKPHDRNSTNMQYVYYFLYLYQNELKVSAKGGMQPFIPLNVFRQRCYIPIPPEKEQERIVAEVEKWFALIDEIEVNKQDLQDYVKQAKSKILSIAISGKLVSQDPTDEPAIDLLRRINPEFVPCDTSHYANLPQGWCICRIHDVFDVSMGSSPTGDSLNREHKGTEFHQGKICFSDIYLQPSEVYTTMPTKLADAHTILLCVRAPVGVVNITERAICIGRGLCALKPKTDVDLMFAFYAMQTHESNFDKQATGSTFKAISGSIIRDEEFILPPYNEQIRIRQTIENVFSQLDNITAEL